MHGYQENEKMAEGDGGLFLGNHAPELAKIAQECCHDPYTTTCKTVL